MVPLIVSHRGLCLVHPENTLPAFRAAARLGARYVETDIQLTSDLVPVLFHDSSLRRLLGVPGDVTRTPWRVLRRLTVMPPPRSLAREAPVAPLKAFASFLKRHPRVTAFVEIKRESLARFGAKAVLAAVEAVLKKVKRQCVIISFDRVVLCLARRRWRIGTILSRWKQLRQDQKKMKPAYVFCDRGLLPRKGSLRLGKARLCVYEIRTVKEALVLGKRGAAMVEGRDAGGLLRARGARPRAR